MTPANSTYSTRLTGPQLRVLHDTLSVVLNDPDWAQTTSTSARDMETLGRAHEKIMENLRQSWRDSSTPAGTLST